MKKFINSAKKVKFFMKELGIDLTINEKRKLIFVMTVMQVYYENNMI